MRLHLLPAAGAPRVIDVAFGGVVIGRAGDDVELPGRSISKRHARFIRLGDALFVEDLGSKNGTFVSGERVKGRVRVRPGDTILMGDVLAIVSDEQPGNAADSMMHMLPVTTSEDGDVVTVDSLSSGSGEFDIAAALRSTGPGVRIILAVANERALVLTARTPLRMLLSRQERGSLGMRIYRERQRVFFEHDGNVRELGPLDVVELPELKVRLLPIEDALPYASSIPVPGGFLAFLPDDAPLVE